MAIENVNFSRVKLLGGFWKKRYQLNEEKSVYAVQKRFEETGRFDAIRFIEGNKNVHVYYDSDVAKWMEAVAYLLAKNRKKHADLEKFCDDLIACIEKNQTQDGYFNSYFQQVEPDKVFTRRNDHELYCAGHLIEAAIAYDKYLGKGRLLAVVEKYVDYIYRRFISEKTANFITCGHQEIELALFALYEYTGKEKYKELALFFVNSRGNNEKDKKQPIHSLIGAQDNAPARELYKAEGHAVRATYYYSAMADMARLTGDNAMKQACDRLFEDISERKMYVTGGIGSTRYCESFTTAYDLPNLTAYTESCAAIGLVFFAQRMQAMDIVGTYGDLVERILYNGFLSSTSLDGKSFFYENPLEICRKEKNKQTAVRDELRTVLPIWKRQEVFGCSCCPPNINRFVASIGNLIYTQTEEGVYVNQFIASSLDEGLLTVETDYPTTNKIVLSSTNYPYGKLFFRVPAWCDGFNVLYNGKSVSAICKNGYAEVETSDKFVLEIMLDFSPRFIESNPRVRDNVGKVCLINGPVVYCLEEIDNGADLYALFVDKNEKNFKGEYVEEYGMKTFSCQGIRKKANGALYAPSYERECVTLTFIPYYVFANREESDMLVWVNAIQAF
jgi:DUF1680 family protein